MSLVKQWQTGEIAGFETLYHRYKDMVLRTALSMTGDEREAEDILQATFIRVYESRDKFKGDEDAFRRWLYRVTINQCVDAHRKKKPASFSLDQMKDKGFEPGAEFAGSKLEVEDMVWQAMGCLDDKHCSVVVLKYFRELRYEEIAQILNIPLGTVKSRLNTAIGIMRKKLLNERGETLSHEM